MPPSPSWKAVYAVIERGPKKHWLRVGLAFLMVYDSRDMEIYQGELFRALDYSDAPSPEQLAEWNARYQAQWSQPQAAAPIAAAAASGPLGSQGNPIGAPARRVDRF